MLKAVCDSCGYSREFDQKNAGRKFKCPKCAASVVIPLQAHEATPEVPETAAPPPAQPAPLTSENKGSRKLVLWSVIAVVAIAGVVVALRQSSQDDFSRLEDIDITDVQAHRKFQDDEMDKLSNGDMPAGFRHLRGLYRRLGTDENVSLPEYKYYMARLYNRINSIPFFSNYYDSANRQMLLAAEYSNIYDSLYFYADELKNVCPYPYIPAAMIAESMYWELVRYRIDKEQIPAIFIRDQAKADERLNDLINNSLVYYDQDTTQNKVRSRVIIDYSYYQLEMSVDFERPHKNNNNLVRLSKLYDLWKIMEVYKAEEPVLITWNYDVIEREYLPVMRYASKALKN